jgi:hypothetical protein
METALEQNMQGNFSLKIRDRHVGLNFAVRGTGRYQVVQSESGTRPISFG